MVWQEARARLQMPRQSSLEKKTPMRDKAGREMGRCCRSGCVVASRGACLGWQAGSPSMYGHHGMIHASADWWLPKLSRAIQLPPMPTKTQSSSTFNSRSIRWLGQPIVPLGRATRVLQDCLKSHGLIHPIFENTSLPNTLPWNCVNTNFSTNG